MDIQLDAQGTPDVVLQAILQQARAARRAYPASAACVMALRDDIARQVAHADPAAHVAVSVSLTALVQITNPEPPPAPEPEPESADPAE